MIQLDPVSLQNYAIAGVALARTKGDNGTAELLEDLLVGEEHHADWLESQIFVIEQIGIENYLAQHLHD